MAGGGGVATQRSQGEPNTARAVSATPAAAPIGRGRHVRDADWWSCRLAGAAHDRGTTQKRHRIANSEARVLYIKCSRARRLHSYAWTACIRQIARARPPRRACHVEKCSAKRLARAAAGTGPLHLAYVVTLQGGQLPSKISRGICASARTTWNINGTSTHAHTLENVYRNY